MHAVHGTLLTDGGIRGSGGSGAGQGRRERGGPAGSRRCLFRQGPALLACVALLLGIHPFVVSGPVPSSVRARVRIEGTRVMRGISTAREGGQVFAAGQALFEDLMEVTLSRPPLLLPSPFPPHSCFTVHATG